VPTISSSNHSSSILSALARRRLCVYVMLFMSFVTCIDADLTQIGINYFGQNGELKGCINDARAIQRFLCGKALFFS
jgi:hypothetical protein